MDQGQLDANLKGIRQLLSHLHGEVTALESSYTQVLQVLRKLEGDATHDDLSGLYRRKPFFEKWEELLSQCGKMNENAGMLLRFVSLRLQLFCLFENFRFFTIVFFNFLRIKRYFLFVLAGN